MADGLLCPGAEQARENNNAKRGAIEQSYGYNVRHVNYVPRGIVFTRPTPSEWSPDTEFAGVKADRVRNAAEKIQFMDAMTMFVEPEHSNHYLKIDGYDDYDDGAPVPGGGRVCAYRHSRERRGDGARINIVFWDGHAATMSRGEVAAVRTPQTVDADGPIANRTPAWDRHWELGVP